MPIEDWIGRTESAADVVTAAPIAALAAALDRDDPPSRPRDPVPVLWHWLYFLPLHKPSDLAADGHARLGDFLPPVPLARRMYAGGRVEIRHPLRVGDAIERTSQVVDVVQKEGRAGPLVFVKVRHEISNRNGVAVIEDHDIVYRGVDVGPVDARRAGDAGADKVRPTVRGADPIGSANSAIPTAAWTREIVPDEILLFRYSALTFNSYRIHYDRRFATLVQGYPGLVVHAPLVATLLADLLRRHLPDASVSTFTFRAHRPLFDGAPLLLCGGPADDQRSVALWARDPDGPVAVEATATL